MKRLARLLHCTEGSAYTLVLGLALALGVTAFTVPAVINHRPPPPPRVIPFQDLSLGDSVAPLTVEESGFAGAPASLSGIPPTGLPVSTTAGAVTAVSFVRLSGQARILRLGVDAKTARGAEAAKVAVCPIQTETWQPLRDMALSAAPAYDCESPVSGVPSPDGAWTFDLGRFTDRAGSKGFAIVPMPAVPGAAPGPDFTIVFTPAPPPASPSSPPPSSSAHQPAAP